MGYGNNEKEKKEVEIKLNEEMVVHENYRVPIET